MRANHVQIENTTKHELANMIAQNLFPTFPADSPAVKGEARQLMKSNKDNLVAIAEFGGLI